MKDNSWQNFLNKGAQNGPKGKGGKQAGAASTKGNKAAPKQMNRPFLQNHRIIVASILSADRMLAMLYKVL